MKQVTFLLALLVSVFALGLEGQSPARGPIGRSSTFSVVEAGIPAMQAATAKGQITSRQLVEQYLN